MTFKRSFDSLYIYGATTLLAAMPQIGHTQSQSHYMGVPTQPVVQALPLTTVASPTFLVSLNKTEIVKLPAQTNAIIVGNPDIADISVHSSDTIFVVGRSYGETNLVVLNSAGDLILNATLQVTSALSDNGVRLHFGGGQRETYSCAPYCVGAPILGDSPDFITLNSNTNNINISNTTAFGGTGITTNSVEGFDN